MLRVELANQDALTDINSIQASGANFFSPSQLEAYIVQNRVYSASASDDGHLLGFMIISELPFEFELLNIVVNIEARRQRVAFALIEFLLAQAHEQDKESVLLEVAEDNLAAIELYQKFGFEEVGRRKNYYPTTSAGQKLDAILMKKYLDR